MKIRKSFLIFLISLIPSFAWGASQTYYVTQNGSGSRNGSTYANSWAIHDFNNPANWSSVENAPKIDPGDTVYLCDTITSGVRIQASGILGNVITIRGDYNGHAGIISGPGSDDIGIEVIGKDYLSTFVPEEEHELLSQVLKNLIQNNKGQVNENRILKKDGKTLLIEWHKRPILDKKGNLDYFFGAGINITKRRKAEQELSKYREHLEELVKERTKELEEKNKELERFNNLFVDREFRIKELKDKVKELEKKLNSVL